ncbi:MAG: ABC transporter permease subunit [Clostridiales bacterium]|jgi:NitT/TauT family transport system permease protein|nr:ABC transporter permease subunit [Clostridiales bacterium]
MGKKQHKGFFYYERKYKRAVYFVLSFLFMLGLWWLLSETTFKRSGVIPSPQKAFAALSEILKTQKLWTAVNNTLTKSLAGFFISMVLGFVFAVTAATSDRFKHFFDPVVSVLRSVPTLGVTYILFMWLDGRKTAIVIGVLIILPMLYSTMYGAITNVDKKLIDMAAVYKVSKVRRITGIYLPAVTPYIFSSAIAGLGLNIKVVIAAEIIGIPRDTIGSFIFRGYNMFDYTALFVWVIIAVAVSFLCEALLKLIMRFCMPWKYENVKSVFKVFRLIKPKGEASNK